MPIGEVFDFLDRVEGVVGFIGFGKRDGSGGDDHRERLHVFGTGEGRPVH